jgi:cytoskeletal protein RodZ
MDRFRKLGQRKGSYERLDNDSGYSEPESQPLTRSESEDDESYLESQEEEEEIEEVEEFSWLVYAVFSLLGMAMLWSWYALLPFYPPG